MKFLAALASAVSLTFAHIAPAHADTPPAVLCDSGKRVDRSAALFYADKINGKGSLGNTTQTASGKDPSTPGWRARILTRNRPLEGPTTLRLRVGYVSMWSTLGLTVKGEVPLDPIPGTVYRVTGTLGEDYSAAWVEDSSGQRVTDIVESFGKDRARAEAARESALALAQPNPSLSPQEAFLQQGEGECSEIIIARFGVRRQFC